MSQDGSPDGKELGDLHSHLVPGVDDGARNVEESVGAIRRLAAAGVGHILTTPHLEASVLESPAAFEDRLAAVEAAWTRVGEALPPELGAVSLYRGFEILLDLPDPDLSDPRVRLAGSRYVLVEWPHMRLPRGTVDVIARLVEKGLVPVVAHPARYAGLGPHLELAGEWRRVGALLQVNYGSLHGRYGRDVRARAIGLLRRGWVDLLSSDYHARPHVGIFVDETRRWLDDLGMSESFTVLASINPRRIMEDRDLVLVPPLAVPRGLWGRVKSLFQPEGVDA